MRKIFIYGSKDKGGIGLTTALLAILTILRATGEGLFDVYAIDADGFNRTLLQRLGQRDEKGGLLIDQNPFVGVVEADLFERDGAAPIFEAITSDARVVVVDTPAGGLRQSDQLSENLTARHLMQYCIDNGRKPIVMVPFGPTLASIRGVGKALETFGEGAAFVAIKNSVGILERDYRLWNANGALDRYDRPQGGQVRKAFEEAGGRTIVAPALSAGANAVAEAMSLTYRDAVTYNGQDWRAYDGLNVGSWLKSWVDQLRTIVDVLEMDDVKWKAF